MAVIVAFLEFVAVQGAPVKLPRVQVKVQPRVDVLKWVSVHK